ncbi:TPA: hypothetical protein ACKR7U_005782 [Pseudomonas aeruginosa]
MTESKICTCPSGDGSLRWPCPAHPAVEQAVGDERAAFKTAYLAEFDCDADGDDNMAHSNTAWRAWKMARAVLAQPSPAQAEAERPEVVGYLATAEHPKHGQPHKAFNYFKDQHDAQVAHWRERGCTVTEDRLMTVSQHERIVGTLRAKIAQLRQHKNDYMDAGQEKYRALQNEIKERVAEIARLDGLVSGRTAERDAALARVAELEAKLGKLEKQEPVAVVKGDGSLGAGFPSGTKLYAAPVAQAQQLNDLDKQCRDDVARALGLRPNQERGFAWSYLLASIKSCVKASGDSAQAQHSVPIAPELMRALGLVVAALEADGDRPTSKYALSELKKVLAAAPGKDGRDE